MHYSPFLIDMDGNIENKFFGTDLKNEGTYVQVTLYCMSSVSLFTTQDIFFMLMLSLFNIGDMKLADRFWWLVMSGKFW